MSRCACIPTNGCRGAHTYVLDEHARRACIALQQSTSCDHDACAPLQQCDAWKYLGLVFTATRGVVDGMLEMQRRQNAAAKLLRRRCMRLDFHYSVDVTMELYLTTVAPTASYGCEVWGLRQMVAECQTGRNKLETSYVQTMRELCGVRRSIPAAVLLQELGELSLTVE